MNQEGIQEYFAGLFAANDRAIEQAEYYKKAYGAALDIVVKQQSEIERLRKEMKK